MRRNMLRWPGWMASSIPPIELTEAWKKITFNGFHDLAAGSGIGVIYRDAQKDFDQVRWATNEISAKALKTLAAHRYERSGWSAGAGLQSAGVGALGPVTVDVQMPAPAAGVVGAGCTRSGAALAGYFERCEDAYLPSARRGSRCAVDGIRSVARSSRQAHLCERSQE